MERFKNAFRIEFSVRLLLSGTVASNNWIALFEKIFYTLTLYQILSDLSFNASALDRLYVYSLKLHIQDTSAVRAQSRKQCFILVVQYCQHAS